MRKFGFDTMFGPVILENMKRMNQLAKILTSLWLSIQIFLLWFCISMEGWRKWTGKEETATKELLESLSVRPPFWMLHLRMRSPSTSPTCSKVLTVWQSRHLVMITGSKTFVWSHPLSNSSKSMHSLRGRRLEGKGKGVLGARETRGLPRTPLAFLSRLKLPFPSLSNVLPRRLRKKGNGVPNLQSDNIKSSGKGDGREISLFQTDKQRLALSYTVILFFYSQCGSLCSNWLAVNTARRTTNCTFYHLSIFFRQIANFCGKLGEQAGFKRREYGQCAEQRYSWFTPSTMPLMWKVLFAFIYLLLFTEGKSNPAQVGPISLV